MYVSTYVCMYILVSSFAYVMKNPGRNIVWLSIDRQQLKRQLNFGMISPPMFSYVCYAPCVHGECLCVCCNACFFIWWYAYWISWRLWRWFVFHRLSRGHHSTLHDEQGKLTFPEFEIVIVLYCCMFVRECASGSTHVYEASEMVCDSWCFDCTYM